jgi:hypothetical protein
MWLTAEVSSIPLGPEGNLATVSKAAPIPRKSEGWARSLPEKRSSHDDDDGRDGGGGQRPFVASWQASATVLDPLQKLLTWLS